jgi:hypothetical protein
MPNPYETLGDAMINSVVAGSRGQIGGDPVGLPERLRQYAFYRQENASTAGDALLVNDLLNAAKLLRRAGLE